MSSRLLRQKFPMRPSINISKISVGCRCFNLTTIPILPMCSRATGRSERMMRMRSPGFTDHLRVRFNVSAGCPKRISITEARTGCHRFDLGDEERARTVVLPATEFTHSDRREIPVPGMKGVDDTSDVCPAPPVVLRVARAYYDTHGPGSDAYPVLISTPTLPRDRAPRLSNRGVAFLDHGSYCTLQRIGMHGLELIR